MSKYDSAADTLAHIDRVRELMDQFCACLEIRAECHDASKLASPEKEAFDVFTPRLREMTYGSEEYFASLKELKPALDHHYALNSHHPEHYPDGIDGMNLFDLVEMFCDQKAASERHEDGDFAESIKKNAVRFKMSPQLVSVFENTRKCMFPGPD